MALSARTRLAGTVRNVGTDGLMTEVEAGAELDAVIKMTEVMVEN